MENSLVLSRESQESVVLAGYGGFDRMLKVTVLGIKGRRVILGFEVDADVPVHRQEVWERLRGRGRANSFISTSGGQNAMAAL